MKRLLIATLAATLVLTSLTACGKKDAERDYETSRVLYSDNDTETETDETETDETKEVVTTDSDTSSDKKDKESSKASSKSSSKEASSKAASSKAASSKTTASKAASSKTTTSKAASSDASRTAVSSAARTSSAPTSSVTSSENTSSKDSETDTAASTDTELLTDTDTASETDTATTDSDVIADVFDPESDLRFSYGSSYIDLHDNIETVVAMIGEPDSISTVGNCLGGEIKLYSYASMGFEINAYPTDDDSFEVGSIRILTSDVKTEKNVTIGSPIEDMINAYGSGYTALGASTYKYADIDGNYLMIAADDDYVSDIIISVDTTGM